MTAVEKVQGWLSAYRNYRYWKARRTDRWLVDGLRFQYQSQGPDAIAAMDAGLEKIRSR